MDLEASMIARRRRNNSGSENKAILSSPGTVNNTSASLGDQGGKYRHSSPPPLAVTPVLDPDMTCRDRSNEFMSAVKLLQSRQVIPSSIINF